MATTVDHAIILPDVPDEVRQALLVAPEVEYATISAGGLPICNPVYYYFNRSGATLDISTGVAYPAKVERARGNPRIGMLFAPGVAAHDPAILGSLSAERAAASGAASATNPEEQPVVLISALAAVRDGDIQANTDRYVDEFLRDHPQRAPWEEEKKRVWYYARLWVECTPMEILWWPRGLGGGEAPRRWTAPPDMPIPASDPMPVRPATKPASWPASDWRETAERTLKTVPLPTVTAVSAGGYPLPMPTLAARVVEDGFELTVPDWTPWPVEGPACLTFAYAATFLGRLSREGRSTLFTVDRLIGNLPVAGNNKALDETSLEGRDRLMARLQAELDRRGQPMPVVRQPPGR
jgi:hypothetical protein